MNSIVARAYAATLIVVFIGGCSSGNSTVPLPAAEGASSQAVAARLLSDSKNGRRYHGKRERPDRFSGLAGKGAADLRAVATFALAAEATRKRRRPFHQPENITASLEGVRMATLAIRPAAVAPLGTAKTLVLYDTAGTWGYLGELYAMATGNLAGHFGPVTFEAVGAYTAGQLAKYSAAIYLGSTYYSAGADGVPAAFYTDVASGVRPVIWAGDNIWNFADSIGPANFEAKYGWDPTSSYYSNSSGSIGTVTTVDYKTAALTRTFPAGTDGGVLRPHILGGTYPAVTTLATAVDTSTSPATNFPWAIASGNLTYVGEIPFQYVSEKDRVLAFEDLLFNPLAPATPVRHRALVRIEDLNPSDDPTQDMAMASYLYSQNIPFGFGVIPEYRDPLGYYTGGVPQTITLAQAPKVVTALKYMVSHGGTIVDHGYTHQYDTADNPYDGVSGDDAEFFRASIDSGNYVVWNNPVAEDSAAWVQGRVNNALAGIASVGLPKPGIWEFPHYAASATDYKTIAGIFPERYERSFYFNGILSGGTISGTSYIGQFFPYPIVDAYGTKVLPENLGDYEPVEDNNNPPRLAADIVTEATANTVVRDGFASFFIHAYDGTTVLQQVVTGIKGAGYTFVSPATL